MKATLLLLLIFALPATALELYRYKDKNGKWAFTDKKPENVKNVKKQIIKERRKQSLTVKLERYQTKTSVVYKARNELYAPVVFSFIEPKFSNVNLDRDITKSQLLPADSVTTILKVYLPSDKVRWSSGFSYKLNMGDPSLKVNKNLAVAVPFARGTKYFVGQAFNGKFSHSNKYNRYAIDVSMPVGTHINAVESGRVVDVAFGHYKAGISREFLDKANVIRILHDDGSIATYAHLKWEGIRVRAGDYVQKGQYIGDSGNTGFSTGPHLHFVIHANTGNGLVSVPFKFVDALGYAFTPKQGMWLKSK